MSRCLATIVVFNALGCTVETSDTQPSKESLASDSAIECPDATQDQIMDIVESACLLLIDCDGLDIAMEDCLDLMRPDVEMGECTASSCQVEECLSNGGFQCQDNIENQHSSCEDVLICTN